MKKLLPMLNTLLFALPLQAQAPAASQIPTYARVWDFLEVNAPALDAALTDFRAYLGTRSGYWGYTYYAGDNGHRYVAANMGGLTEMARQDSLASVFSGAMPNSAAFLKRWYSGFGGITQTIWRSMPSLSNPPAGMTSAEVNTKYPFRRASTRFVRPGSEGAFEAVLRDLFALDRRNDVGSPVMVYSMVVGSNAPADMIVTYSESAANYWTVSEAHRVKRNGDPAWAPLSQRLAKVSRIIESVSLTRDPNRS